MLWKSLFSQCLSMYAIAKCEHVKAKGYLLLAGWAPDNSLISETASEIETLASFNKLPFFKFSTHKQLCLRREKSAWGQCTPLPLCKEPPLVPIATPSVSFFTKGAHAQDPENAWEPHKAHCLHANNKWEKNFWVSFMDLPLKMAERPWRMFWFCRHQTKDQLV